MTIERFAKYPLSILDQLVVENYTRREKILIDGYKIKTNSQRYILFKTSMQCVKCGCKGEYFCLEKDVEYVNSAFHFNLYAVVDGEERLMTKDHIVPISKGGLNKQENYQVMCRICNFEKSNNHE